jgi:hypothetical protein
MDLQQIYNKLEKLDEKLDLYVQKTAVLEEKQNNMSGQLKWILGIALSSISSIIAYAMNKLNP